MLVPSTALRCFRGNMLVIRNFRHAASSMGFSPFNVQQNLFLCFRIGAYNWPALGTMNLDHSQRAKVSQWIAEGLKLSDIQNRLATEFGLRMTYMDVRFLVDDLK